MDSYGTDTAHPDSDLTTCPDTANGCERRQCGLWGCTELQCVGGITRQPFPAPSELARRGDDLTADFMALAGSHMTTTKVLARLVHRARWVLGAVPASCTYEFLKAIEAAEKDLGL